jgi:hypothetical protein
MPLWKNPVGTDEVAGVAARPLLQIILVSGSASQNSPTGWTSVTTLPSHSPEASTSAIVSSATRFDLVMCPTGRRAHDHCLAVQRRRIVDLEEEFQDVPVARHCRVEDNLDPLGMRAVITIRGVRNIAARVTHTGRDDAGPLADQIPCPRNILLREQRADAC